MEEPEINISKALFSRSPGVHRFSSRDATKQSEDTEQTLRTLSWHCGNPAKELLARWEKEEKKKASQNAHPVPPWSVLRLANASHFLLAAADDDFLLKFPPCLLEAQHPASLLACFCLLVLFPPSPHSPGCWSVTIPELWQVYTRCRCPSLEKHSLRNPRGSMPIPVTTRSARVHKLSSLQGTVTKLLHQASGWPPARHADLLASCLVFADSWKLFSDN